MLKNKFIRSDGSVIDSSTIVSCKYTSQVNSQKNLTVGDVTSDKVDLEIRNPSSEIVSGEPLTYYQIEDDVETLIGVFYAESPTISSKSTCKITAYDGIAKLSCDFSEWLSNNQDQFPMTLKALIEKVLIVSGITGFNGTFENEDLEVSAFYANGVTCRQVVSWIAQIAGCYCKCDTSGNLEFSWFQQSDITVSAYSNTSTFKYMQDSMKKMSYQTDKIMRVQFKQDTEDVGVIYPEDATGNVFSIFQNGLTAQFSKDTILQIAESLYTKLKDITYTPIEFSVAPTSSIKAGDIISVTDSSGITVYTYVMSVSTSAKGTSVTSTGDKNYAEKAAVSSEAYKNIPGKVLNLTKDIDGIRAENRDTEGKLASLELNVDGISTIVSQQQEETEAIKTRMTQIEQNADQIALSVQQIVDNGVSKVTTEFGLTVDGSCVDIHRSGTEMHNSLDETGMYVKRGDEVMLQANKDGVVATDVTIRNYLIVGSNARFEDYGTNRTACFYIGSTS